MTHHLTFKDIIALGFMTFALFVGAGNIIFPPVVGLQSGEYVWTAALGFMITAVSLPVMTIVAIARVGGGIENLSIPIGKTASLILAFVCYLTVGPLFATPRTATVSFETGIVPITGNSSLPLLIYSVIYFLLVIFISLYPGKLLDTVGHFLAPLKIIALTALGIAVLIWPTGGDLISTAEYQNSAFTIGFINGYLTMDTLGALVFGIIITNAIRSRGVKDSILLMRYTILAGVIAGIGLTLVYLSLFKLGSGSSELVHKGATGAEILHAYVQHNFGFMGSFFLATLIFLACMVTGVGLTCSCAEFFARYLPLSYKSLVFILCFFSMLVSNLGLNHLIKLSFPVLTAIYPPCIILVILSFTLNWWNKSSRIVGPTMLVSLLFGAIDASRITFLKNSLPLFIKHLPLFKNGLVWLVPSLIMLVIFIAIDFIKGPELSVNNQE